MLGINNLERQHKEIWELLFKIKHIVNSNNINESIEDLVMNINTLAGKLNVHMNSEDKYLYPNLKKSNNEELRDMAEQYSKEMGNIYIEFNNFKNKFNTKNKILNNLDCFLVGSKELMKMLENRISKEDKHLYPKVKSL